MRKLYLIGCTILSLALFAGCENTKVTPATVQPVPAEAERPSIAVEQANTGTDLATGRIATGDTLRLTVSAVSNKFPIRSITVTRIIGNRETVVPGYPITTGFNTANEHRFVFKYGLFERSGTVQFRFTVADDSAGKSSRASYCNFTLRLIRNDSLGNVLLSSQNDTVRLQRGVSFYNSYNRLTSNSIGAIPTFTDITYAVVNGEPCFVSPAARSQYGLNTLTQPGVTLWDTTALRITTSRPKALYTMAGPTLQIIPIKKDSTYKFTNTSGYKGVVLVKSILDSIPVKFARKNSFVRPKPGGGGDSLIIRDTIVDTVYRSRAVRVNFAIKVTSDR